jgi:rifampin ADP-ribosylating transferase
VTTQEEPVWTPVSYENCAQVDGPFFHGTRAALSIGDRLTTGHPSHFEDGRAARHLYFSALLEPAIWGAELAMALAGAPGGGVIYIVEPTGPFEDDPNLTNKRFPGNPTRSYRTREPLLVVGVVEAWEGHSAEVLQGMLDALAHLKQQGLSVIED